MKQLLVQIDDRLAAALERHAPAQSRTRSEFIRRAIRRALDAESEAAMAAAYHDTPDVAPAHFDPASWDATWTRKGQPPRGKAPKARAGSGRRPRRSK